ncbi:SBBP repeat-containing protein [Polluticaenibacter yanchengensis]|uniref:SBBP repeat-containing protein n=1 Tax=Polluticaenibacter yanchengensis TaxID=3014562 RepID=A0ABT4UM34_9BACT|nr:SBBP repeat-containing protein [Chitinophagaceae bacterium LY-5]
MTLRGIILCVIITLAGSLKLPAQCGGLDIIIANDQSGSVDSHENALSRSFIAEFAAEMPLGVAAGENRIAIADWEAGSRYLLCDFPGAGQGFTTHFSDVYHYSKAPRVLTGGTSIHLALQQSFNFLNKDTLANRQKVLLLITDAGNTSDEDAVLALAEEIKSTGIYIVVLAVDEAISNTFLEQVASTGGFFYARDYLLLSSKVADYTKSMVDAACKGNMPAVNLKVTLNRFDAYNCLPGPGNYYLEMDIVNVGILAWDAPVAISVFNKSIYEFGARLVDVQYTDRIRIETGEKITVKIPVPELAKWKTASVIINVDGIKYPLVQPFYAVAYKSNMVDPLELNIHNNISEAIERVDGEGCVPKSTVIVDVTGNSLPCTDSIIYNVKICNDGNVDVLLEDLTPIADEPLELVAMASRLDSTKSNFLATYFGGVLNDVAYGMAVDAKGFIYVTGQTNSTTNIATPYAFQAKPGGGSDVFVAKFDKKLKLIWSSYFGGTGNDIAYDIALDNNGFLYVTGETSLSTGLSTAGAHQTKNSGSVDAFVFKMSVDGQMVWSSYFGGEQADYGRSVKVDDKGFVYIAGNTSSNTGIAFNAKHQDRFGGGNADAFLCRFNSDGALLWSTYFGGEAIESGFGLALDAKENIYLTGLTSSTRSVAFNARHQAIKNSGNDAYIAKFSNEGSMLWSTYFGGENNDNGIAVAVDKNDNVYLSGNTSSNNNIATVNGFQNVKSGGTDAFMAKLNGDGVLVWGSYYGGSETDNVRRVLTDASGNVFFSGTTYSSNLPDVVLLNRKFAGGADYFVAKINTSGSLEYSGYYGGANNEIQNAFCLDAFGNIYLAGSSNSFDIGSDYVHQTDFAGGNDALIFKIENNAEILLKAGTCVSVNYLYRTQSRTIDTYDFSVNVNAAYRNVGGRVPDVLPDANGFDGSRHATDDVVYNPGKKDCPVGEKLTVDIKFKHPGNCNIDELSVMEIRINNNTGIVLTDLLMDIGLTNHNNGFAGELNSGNTSFYFSQPNKLSPAYPFLNNAFLGKDQVINLPVYSLPIGETILQVNVYQQQGNYEVTVALKNLPELVAGKKQTGDTVNVYSSNYVLPEIVFPQVPAAISLNDILIIDNVQLTNTVEVEWVSQSTGKVSEYLSPDKKTTMLHYTPGAKDIADGLLQLSLSAKSAGGCIVLKQLTVNITDVAYDFGDAPLSYDYNALQTAIVAASTTREGLHIGNLPPGTEPQKKVSDFADGDGVEEDGVGSNTCAFVKEINGKYSLYVTATNTTADTAYLKAFADWRAKGDFTAPEDRSTNTVTVLPGTPAQVYQLKFTFNDITSAHKFIRLRLSTDSLAVQKPYGRTIAGEVEDFYLAILEKAMSENKVAICAGDKVIVGSSVYEFPGVYTDILHTVNHCDSTVVTIITYAPNCTIANCDIQFPNAFTPNNDGSNDVFKPLNVCEILSQYQLNIFDRYGNRVFATNNKYAVWDGNTNGQRNQSGTFVWHCRYVNGEGKTVHKKGTVILIR